VEHAFGKMMIGRWGCLDHWKQNDTHLLKCAFTVCCWAVETETKIAVGLDTRYEGAFDVEQAKQDTADCNMFRQRYKKKLAEEKAAKKRPAPKKAVPKKAPPKDARGVKKLRKTKPFKVVPKPRKYKYRTSEAVQRSILQQYYPKKKHLR